MLLPHQSFVAKRWIKILPRIKVLPYYLHVFQLQKDFSFYEVGVDGEIVEERWYRGEYERGESKGGYIPLLFID